MKKLNKKWMIIPITLFVIVITIIVLFVIFNKLENDQKVNYEYEVYININPFVKLMIKKNCDETKCGIPYVVSYELINEDAKRIYVDTDIKNKTIYDAIQILGNTAKDNNIEVAKVEIYTKYKDLTFNPDDYDWEMDYNIVTQEELDKIEEDKTIEDPNDPIITKEFNNIEIKPYIFASCTNPNNPNWYLDGEPDPSTVYLPTMQDGIMMIETTGCNYEFGEFGSNISLESEGYPLAKSIFLKGPKSKVEQMKVLSINPEYTDRNIAVNLFLFVNTPQDGRYNIEAAVLNKDIEVIIPEGSDMKVKFRSNAISKEFNGLTVSNTNLPAYGYYDFREDYILQTKYHVDKWSNVQFP